MKTFYNFRNDRYNLAWLLSKENKKSKIICLNQPYFCNRQKYKLNAKKRMLESYSLQLKFMMILSSNKAVLAH